MIYPTAPPLPKDPSLYGAYSSLYKAYLKSVERCARVQKAVTPPTVQVAPLTLQPASLGGKTAKPVKKGLNQGFSRAERRKILSIYPTLGGPALWEQVRKLTVRECKTALGELAALKKAGAKSEDPKVVKVLQRIGTLTQGRDTKVSPSTAPAAGAEKHTSESKGKSLPPRDFALHPEAKVYYRAARQQAVYQMAAAGEVSTKAEAQAVFKEKRRQALMIWLEANPGKSENDWILEKRSALKANLTGDGSEEPYLKPL